MSATKTNDKNPHFTEHARIYRQFLDPEERLKIGYVPNAFDDFGLSGQFPDLAEASETWKKEIDELMKKAAGVTANIIKLKEFRRYFDEPCKLSMGWTVNEVLMNHKNPPLGFHLWSVNLGDNHNLRLVFMKPSQLVVAVDQYFHEGDHNEGFHWMLRLDGDARDHLALKIDSHRLHVALKVLSDAEKAKVYFRARIFSSEIFSD